MLLLEGGGHTKAILDCLDKDGFLLAIDRDPEAIEFAKILNVDPRFKIEQAPFSIIENLTKKNNIAGKVNGILLDLGLSSPQLDDPARGFSFLHDGPLDMRMDPTIGINAEKWVNEAKEETIANVLWEYGEERFSRRIARAIVEERKTEPITTTGRLADIVKRANPKWERHKHPATRSFQAIRIFLNQELEELKVCLEQCLDVLTIGGRLSVISFHSLEDRIVKRFIRDNAVAKNGEFLLDSRLRGNDVEPRLKKIGKIIRPTEEEIKQNPRARSAILRVAKKVA